MGIDVYLKDEAGAELDALHDPRMILSRFAMSDAARESRLLRFLDPYGNLILNRAQAIALRKDVAAILPSQDEPTKAILQRIVEMAEQSEREIHLYLWFIGD